VAVVHQMMRQSEARGAESDDQHFISRMCARHRAI
jgi:hypothetical protein